jgi:hypothetical protein
MASASSSAPTMVRTAGVTSMQLSTLLRNLGLAFLESHQPG